MEFRRLNWDAWLHINSNKEVEDISSELPDSFLVIGQIMRAKIKYDGKTWYASGWHIDRSVYVDLQEIET